MAAAQTRQPFPQMNTPFVDTSEARAGWISVPWYRLLINLWARTGTAPGVAQQQIVLGSPFLYQAADSGTLIYDSGQATISRDNGTNWYSCGQGGGAIPMLVLDQVRIVWGVTPVVVWLPNA